MLFQSTGLIPTDYSRQTRETVATSEWLTTRLARTSVTFSPLHLDLLVQLVVVRLGLPLLSQLSVPSAMVAGCKRPDSPL